MTNAAKRVTTPGVVALQPGAACELRRGTAALVTLMPRLRWLEQQTVGRSGRADPSRRRMRSTQRCTNESRPTPWLRTTSTAWPITADPDRAISAPSSVCVHEGVDVDPLEHRVEVDLGDDLIEVEAVDDGLQVDPGDEVVEVRRGQHGVDVDPGEQAVDVHPLQQQIDVELVEHLVQVDAGPAAPAGRPGP